MPQDLAGLVHWSSAAVRWDGDSFQLEMSTAIEGGAADWLDLNLRDLLSREIGAVDVSVVPAVRASPPTSGFADFGSIRIGRLREPLPNPGVLHRVMANAVAEAYSAFERATAAARPWVEQIRGLS